MKNWKNKSQLTSAVIIDADIRLQQINAEKIPSQVASHLI